MLRAVRTLISLARGSSEGDSGNSHRGCWVLSGNKCLRSSSSRLEKKT